MTTYRWPGILRGCAYGDAWGDDNEFRTIHYLTDPQFDGPEGPNMPASLRITDDTQMTLALAKALNGAADQTPQMLRARVIDEWITWYHDPDNNRAPGRQCLNAIGQLARDRYWMEATDDRNDGCGTVMRNSPTAMLPEGLWQPVAAWQAVSTHGGTNGVAACLVMAATMREALAGRAKPGELTETALELALSYEFDMRKIGKWIAWAPAINSDDPVAQEAYLDGGLTTMTKLLERTADAVSTFQAKPWQDDPCGVGGQGWRAHECLATALLAADSFPDDPVNALRRATVTNGDSDSIAAVTGALLGSVHDDPWPAEWFGRLEPRYQEWITEADEYNFEGELS